MYKSLTKFGSTKVSEGVRNHLQFALSVEEVYPPLGYLRLCSAASDVTENLFR